MISLSKFHQNFVYSSRVIFIVTHAHVYTHSQHYAQTLLALSILNRVCPWYSLLNQSEEKSSSTREQQMAEESVHRKSLTGLQMGVAKGGFCGWALHTYELELLFDAPAGRAISTSLLRAMSPPNLGTKQPRQITTLRPWLSLCLAPSQPNPGQGQPGINHLTSGPFEFITDQKHNLKFLT